MSIGRGYWLACDKCNFETTDTKPTIKEAKQEGRREGWRVGKTKHYCPKCKLNMKPDSRKEAAKND